MNSKIVRGSLVSYGNGWQWTIVDDEGEITYRTDRDGYGLWRVGSYTGRWAGNYEDKQILGNMQFSLSAKREAARKKIKRYFME